MKGYVITQEENKQIQSLDLPKNVRLEPITLNDGRLILEENMMKNKDFKNALKFCKGETIKYEYTDVKDYIKE